MKVSHAPAELTPPMRPGALPPFHELGFLPFQELCRDLLDAQSVIAVCELYGVPGETQHGVDLLAHRREHGGVDVGQCKCYQKFTAALIRTASNEFFTHWRRWEGEDVRRFILFVSADLSGRGCQDEILRQTQQFAAHGIAYEAWSAAKIRNELRPHPEIVRDYIASEEWVRRICGGPALELPPMSLMRSATDRLVQQQFERLAARLSVEVEEHIEVMRSIWREGKRQKVRSWIATLKNDQDQWTVLAHEVQAKVLRLEASLIAEATGDLTRAAALVEEAHALAPLVDDTRVRAIIAYYKGDLEGAIHLLNEAVAIEDLELLAALLIQANRLPEAETALSSSVAGDQGTAETHRLRGLLRLLAKDMPGAQLEILKALEVAPHWHAIRYTAAVIDYYSAISPAALPDTLVGWPPPLEWAYVRTDDESLRRLRRAAATFSALWQEQQAAGQPGRMLLSWRLASLANDPAGQSEAASLCRTILASDPVSSAAIVWGFARSYDFDVDRSEKSLQKLVSKKAAGIEEILALLTCYLSRDRRKQASKLLADTYEVFVAHHVEAAWRFQIAQVLAAENSDASEEQANNLGDPLLVDIGKTPAIWARASQSGDWWPLIRQLWHLWEATRGPNWLYECCDLALQQGEWEYVADKANLLVREVETGSALRIATYAMYNARHYEACLSLLELNNKLFAGSKLPVDLRRIRISCQQALGIVSQAVEEAAELTNDDPSPANILALARVCVVQGELSRLKFAVRRAGKRLALPPEGALQLASLLVSEDRQLATDLWKQTLTPELPDELVGDALFLGFQLGLEAEVRPLYPRLAQLAQREGGSIRQFSLQELLSYGRDWQSQATEYDRLYRAGQIPIHVYARFLNRPLVDLYHTLLANNELAPDPLRQPALLVRYGGRAPLVDLPSAATGGHLHVDLTTLLLAAHFGALEYIEAGFSPVHIPDAVQPALLEMRTRLVPHQPAQIERHAVILQLIRANRIHVFEGRARTEGSPSAPAQMLGDDWVSLLAAAGASAGYVVDFLPLHERLPDRKPIDLPPDEVAHVVNCRAVVDALHLHGPLSQNDYERAILDLGQEGVDAFGSTVSRLGCDLFFHANVIDVLAGAGVLPLVSQHYRVHIQESEHNLLNSEIMYQQQVGGVLAWLDRLRNRIARGIAQGTYRVISAAAHRKEPADATALGLEGELLRALMEFEPVAGDLICADDRFLTRFRDRNHTVPLLGLNDVMKSLRDRGQLSEDEYYRILTRMRAANLRYLPLSSDELLYHLGRARVEHGSLLETEELALLRRYTAACLLGSDTMQKPNTNGGEDTDQGELPFVFSLNHAVQETLVKLWDDSSITDEARSAKANWLMDNLHMDHLGMLVVLKWRRPGHESYYMSGLTLGGLISLALSLRDGEPSRSTRRQDYLDWLTGRLLRRRFDGDQLLVAASAEALKQLMLSVEDDLPDKRTAQIATLMLQEFYDDIPVEIRQELWKDVGFMERIGRQPVSAITIEDVVFEASEFYRAAAEAVNGSLASAKALEPAESVAFQPVESGGGSGRFAFSNPTTGTDVIVSNAALALLSRSPDEREAVLRSNRRWFDCSATDYEQAIAYISALSLPQLRIAEAEKWRNSSAAEFYAVVHERLSHREPVDVEELLPPSADGLLRHYRLDASWSMPLPDQLEVAAQDLIETEGPYGAFVRLSGLPVPLPGHLVAAVDELPDDKREELLKRLLRTATSPVSRLHFAHLLVEMHPHNCSYGRLARRVIGELLTHGVREETAAYIAMLRWSYEELRHWSATQGWPASTQLAMVWGHAHQLFLLFQSLGVSVNWVQQAFSRSRHIPREMFEREPGLWLDIAQPHHIARAALLASGIAYAVQNAARPILDDALIDAFRKELFTLSEGLPVPVAPLLVDPSLSSDSLGSFLAMDRSTALTWLVGLEDAQSYSSVTLRSLTQTLLLRLGESSHEPSGWVLMQALLSDMPIYPDMVPEFCATLRNTDFVDLWRQDHSLGAQALKIAAVQTRSASDQALAAKLRGCMLEMVHDLVGASGADALRDLITQPHNKVLQYLLFLLFDAGLAVCQAGRSSEDAVEEFGDLMSDIVRKDPAMRVVCQPIIQNSCDRLKVELGKRLWPALIRMRAC